MHFVSISATALMQVNLMYDMIYDPINHDWSRRDREIHAYYLNMSAEYDVAIPRKITWLCHVVFLLGHCNPVWIRNSAGPWFDHQAMESCQGLPYRLLISSMFEMEKDDLFSFSAHWRLVWKHAATVSSRRFPVEIIVLYGTAQFKTIRIPATLIKQSCFVFKLTDTPI